MKESSSFIAPGFGKAGKAIENWAREEIRAIEQSALTDEEKAQAVGAINAEAVERRKKLGDPYILWSRKPPAKFSK